MAKTKVVKCDCSHDYQDKHYGFNKRLANKANNDYYVCTVCEKRTLISSRK